MNGINVLGRRIDLPELKPVNPFAVKWIHPLFN